MMPGVNAEQPQPDTVEWGSDRMLLPPWLSSAGRLGLVCLTALGSLALLLASVMTGWQVLEVHYELGPNRREIEQTTLGLGEAPPWGTMWVIGVLVLAGCVALVLFGRPAVRGQARVAGLGVAVALAVLLVGALARLQTTSIFQSSGDIEVWPGPGPYLALGSVLLAATLMIAASRSPQSEWGTVWRDRWQSRPRQRADDRARVGEPTDLTVGPAEPLEHPGQRHQPR